MQQSSPAGGASGSIAGSAASAPAGLVPRAPPPIASPGQVQLHIHAPGGAKASAPQTLPVGLQPNQQRPVPVPSLAASAFSPSAGVAGGLGKPVPQALDDFDDEDAALEELDKILAELEQMDDEDDTHTCFDDSNALAAWYDDGSSKQPNSSPNSADRHPTPEKGHHGHHHHGRHHHHHSGAPSLFDRLDSARPELAAQMGRVALEAILRGVNFVVSTDIVGSFGDTDDGAVGLSEDATSRTASDAVGLALSGRPSSSGSVGASPLSTAAASVAGPGGVDGSSGASLTATGGRTSAGSAGAMPPSPLAGRRSSSGNQLPPMPQLAGRTSPAVGGAASPTPPFPVVPQGRNTPVLSPLQPGRASPAPTPPASPAASHGAGRPQMLGAKPSLLNTASPASSTGASGVSPSPSGSASPVSHGAGSVVPPSPTGAALAAQRAGGHSGSVLSLGGASGASSTALLPGETEEQRVKRLKEEEERRQRDKKAAERSAVAAAKHAALQKDADRVRALRMQKPKQLSPLLVEERRKAADREIRKEQLRAQRRAKQLEKERAAEARERELMQAEEWAQERVKWARNYGGREGGWRTIRVFISSTFTDMHGERDSMTRSVFPALNNMCKPRRVRVVPVDLRWGLTAEDTSDTGLGALEHCLLEVDHSRPFFIALVGDRYGWIPPNYRVSDRPEFDWIRAFPFGHSITDMGTSCTGQDADENACSWRCERVAAAC